MEQETFRLDENNTILRKYYESSKNYCVDDINNGDKCFIFFSSNGLYFPNQKSAFEDSIVRKDRYEWRKVSQSSEIVSQAGKIIYVRDIYKQYYVNGINIETDNIDKLCLLLKDMAGDLKVVTCGTSSGGYMAVIAGIYLQAECIYSFGGQWSLEPLLREKSEPYFKESYYFIEMHENDALYNKYYDISELLIHNKIPIMYFYSALNEDDKEQISLLSKRGNTDNVYFFAMKSKVHGYLMINNCYKKVMSLELSELMALYRRFQRKMISLRLWCLCVLPLREALGEILKDIVNSHKSLQYLINVFSRDIAKRK